jgi:hypothetical protein
VPVYIVAHGRIDHLELARLAHGLDHATTTPE